MILELLEARVNSFSRPMAEVLVFSPTVCESQLWKAGRITVNRSVMPGVRSGGWSAPS
jgi:hypothetical protein